jgi:hypothetical protein
MSRRRRESMRSVIAEAYNEVGGCEATFAEFRMVVRAKAELAGFNPALVLFLVRVAIVLWKLWSDMSLRQAPLEPLEGEPDLEAQAPID